MQIKDFIGKTVFWGESKARYTLKEIASPCFKIISETPNENGYYPTYVFKTINGDPISKGVLVFEDSKLTEPFKAAYDAYCHSKDAYYEEIGYWMRKD